MIRKTLTLLWLLFPVGVLAYHFNYGAPHVQRERAAAHLQRIERVALLGGRLGVSNGHWLRENGVLRAGLLLRRRLVGRIVGCLDAG